LGGQHGVRLDHGGPNLFVTSGITNVTVLEVLKAALPRLMILLLFLGLI
jgi:hypothetical protein